MLAEELTFRVDCDTVRKKVVDRWQDRRPEGSAESTRIEGLGWKEEDAAASSFISG
ncbi:hypothetical protein CE91St30_01260 [Raoultibacter timonensis]|uniref:Uncharacterized protein n=1 Tax=Raoultibacter timonensis TaxID=1907662 RepID=A0ABN6MC61_9ACTN|nr:hypothetical protein CE91St30_01260 [Raoultibacter timonensis]BDF49396.1 hypothetical protein CE91St31_01260 [Raoultibacter timonensis]